MLINKLIEYLNHKIQKIIVVYPLERITLESDILKTTGFSLIKSNDDHEWDKLRKSFSSLELFQPNNIEKNSNNKILQNINSDLWLVGFFYGDTDTSLNYICRSIRIFLSLIIAELSKNNIHISKNSITSPYNQIAIFQENKIAKTLWINDLFHSFPGKTIISNENTRNILEAYKVIHSFEQEEFNRFAIFSDYFIKSLNCSSENRVVNLFIAADALWGEEGKNEQFMVEGFVSVLGNSMQNQQKAKKLYKLRCALLHGGCSTIDEWDKYDSYINQYGSEPDIDLMNIILNKINSI